MNYIHELPAEVGFQWDLSNDFQKLYKDLKNILPPLSGMFRGYNLESPKREFLMFLDQLERLFFIKNENPNTRTNSVLGKAGSGYTFKEQVYHSTYKTGMVICIAPKTKWEDLTQVNYMEVMEKELKSYPKQFLKIFTYQNKLYVYMNKQPTWEQLIKLKILQWTLFNNIIETQEPIIMEFLKAMLENNDLNKINQIIEKIMTRPDFNELKYKAITDAFKHGSERQLRTIKAAIESIQKTITDYENSLNEQIVHLRELNTTLAATEAAPELDTKVIIKYLSKHPYIKKVDAVAENLIDFYYEAPIVYYDKYVLDKIIERRDGIAKKVLELFNNPKYEFYTRCKLRFNTDTFNIDLQHLGDVPNGLIGHPHIDRFGCFGSHGKAIRESAAEGDYLGAIEQISQAVLNLNFSDGYVINTMVDMLKNNRSFYRTWKHKETEVMLTTEEVLANEETSTNS